jgi:hypothetical protein
MNQKQAGIPGVNPETAKRLWEGTKWVAGMPFKFLMMETPKWMYPVFGAAAASPIVAHEINKRRQVEGEDKAAALSYFGPETAEYHLEKASQAMDAALSRNKSFQEATRPDPEAMIHGLDRAKAMLHDAKRRAAKTRLHINNPEVRMQSGRDTLMKSPAGKLQVNERELGQDASD